MPKVPVVVCFGELLWDISPDEKKAGGAPFNVAYHLKQQGIDSRVITSIGHDELGDTLKKQLIDWQISTAEIQTNPVKPTGTVIANIDANNEAHYTISTNVAWDEIEFQPAYASLLKHTDIFVYGSLAARSKTSYQTLLQLLQLAAFKVFDINLRPPFYSIEVLNHLLQQADLVKINELELKTINELHGRVFTTEDDAANTLLQMHQLSGLILTKGSKGAVYYDAATKKTFPAIAIKVHDTVGSGDASLAGFLAKKVIGASIDEAMKNSMALGAFNTTKKGACPPYTMAEFEAFKKSNAS